MKKSTIFKICDLIAMESKDQLTQVGSVIIGPSQEIRSTGYNSFPRGINDYDSSRQERPKKYNYMEHAEANAIHNAVRMGVSLMGCSIFVPWTPCSTCARAIIQSGINRVYIATPDIPEHWKESCSASLEMFNEAGIIIEYGKE